MKCRFLRHITLLMFIFCGFVNMNALTPREQQGLKNITEWAIEQQSQLQKAQQEVSDLGNENATLTIANASLTKKEEEKAKEASQNARERDVILYLFAIVVGFYVGTLFGGEVMRNFPAPWSFVACMAVYMLSGLAAYGVGRMILESLSHLIP